MSAPLSLREVIAQREKAAPALEKAIRERVPEPNEYRAMAHFEVGRYTKGAFTGLFCLNQLITEVDGKKLKTPIKKALAEGVDVVIVMSTLEKALRRRVFK